VEVPVASAERAHRLVEVGLVRLDLLHADDVGLLLGDPVEEALATGRADAVGRFSVTMRRREGKRSILYSRGRGICMDERQEFIRFALDAGVLRFGEFRTKAGRDSPYFFNAGLFDDGARLGRLAEFYAQRLLRAKNAGEVAASTCCSVRPTRASRSHRPPRSRWRAPGATCRSRSTARKPRTTARAARWWARRWPAGW
jgi:hypothetical protein